MSMVVGFVLVDDIELYKFWSELFGVYVSEYSDGVNWFDYGVLKDNQVDMVKFNVYLDGFVDFDFDMLIELE